MHRLFVRLSICILALAVTAAPAFAGEILYTKTFGANAAKPVTQTDSVTLPAGRAPYVLNLVNGTSDGQHRAVRVTLSWNHQALVAPADVSADTTALNRDLAQVPAGAQLSVTLNGAVDAFVNIRILGNAPATLPLTNPNLAADNQDQSASGENLREQVLLRIQRQAAAASYVISVAPAAAGPWTEIATAAGGDLATPFLTVIDNGFGPDHTTPNPVDLLSQTAYYRIQAFDAGSNLVKDYPILAVPAYVEWSHGDAGAAATAAPPLLLRALAGACGNGCIYNQPFISDDDFTNTAAMSQESVRAFLDDYSGGYLSQTSVTDRDGVAFDPAQVIYSAAIDNSLNPQVLLATIQKESSAFTKATLSALTLANLTGTSDHGTLRSQIATAAQRLRSFELGHTPGGWQPGHEQATCDFVDTDSNRTCAAGGANRLSVCPANHSTAALLQYTPYLGAAWGGEAGGNALFFNIYYDQFRFGTRPSACGVFQLSGDAPSGRVATALPTLHTHVDTAAGCQSTYTLLLDGKQVASGTLGGDGEVSYTVTTPLAKGRHQAKIHLQTPLCNGLSASHTWQFTVAPGRKVGFVIDDTGSMSDEIDGVKAQLARYVESQTTDPNHPDIEWTLVTFKDDVTVHGTTTDTSTILAWVDALFASGGGDCPEESLGALNAAAGILGGQDGDRAIVFATDASPRDGDVDATIAALKAAAIPVEVVLSGDCVDTTGAAHSRRAQGGLGQELPATLSSKAVFSRISAETGGLFFYLPGATSDQLGDAFAQIIAAAGGTDVQPPALTLELSPPSLWPPTNQLVEVAPVITLHDDVDPTPALQLVAVTSSAPGSSDITITPDGHLWVRATAGRVYTVTYRATDAAGHSTTVSGEIKVVKAK